MATEQQDKKADIVPDLDDDADTAAPVSEARGAPADDDAQESAPAPAEKKLSPAQQARNDAVRRYRELRDSKKEQDAAAADPDDEPEAAAAAPRDEPAAAPAAKTPPAAAPAAAVPATPDPTVEATRALLDHARTLLEEIKAQRAAPAVAEPDNDVGDPAAPGKDDKGTQGRKALDEAKLEDIVERIQIGDKVEGRAALAELIEIMSADSKAAQPAEDIGRMVQSHIARDRLNSEIEQAAATFRDKYKSVADDPDLLDASMRRLGTEMREDLVKAGVKGADIERLSVEQVAAMHQGARLQGHKVRSYNDLFEKVGSDVATKFKINDGAGVRQTETKAAPTGSTLASERMDRKRLSSAQPRAAGVRSTDQSQPKPRSRADVVAEMRRARHFRA